MNCVENLPVYGAIVFCGTAAGVTGPIMNTLSLMFFGARILQSKIHIAFEQSDLVASIRFAFFFVQFACMSVMGFHVAVLAV